MIVTINVPRNKLNPIFFLGFFISPAMKVTLFHASLLKIEPTMDAAMAPSAAIGKYSFIPPSSEILFIFHASCQFVCHVPDLDPIRKPNTIRPNKERSLTDVNVV